jgi:hypothetical protein
METFFHGWRRKWGCVTIWRPGYSLLVHHHPADSDLYLAAAEQATVSEVGLALKQANVDRALGKIQETL